VRDDAPEELLDQYRLDGAVAMRRVLMPLRNALLVDETSLEDAVDAISEACQRWGGAAHLLAPCARDMRELPDSYRVLDAALIDEVWTRDLTKDFRFRGTDRRVQPWSVDHFLPSTLYASRYKRDDWLTVQDALPASDHPWFLSYLAALGHLPDRPRKRLLEAHHLVPDLEWDRVFPYTAEAIDEPGGTDLLARLREPNRHGPAAMTMALLGVPQAARAPDIPASPVLPHEGEVAAEMGPNLAVVYTPGTVSDLCAIWNLRAANGLPRGLPLGLPEGEHAPAILDAWTEEFAQTFWGLRQTRMAVLSTSVARSRLEEIAAAARGPWEVVELADVLRVADRPGRVSSELVGFRNGLAEVSGWDAEDRSELARRVGGFRVPQATARFLRPDRRLPPLGALDADYPFEATYRGGGFERVDSRYDQLVSIRWPAGWTVLDAVAQERGLRVAPSTAGQAAAAFLSHVRSWQGLEVLLSRDVLDMLYRLGERSGMTWFRKKLRQLARSVAGEDADVLARLESAISGISVRPTDHGQHTIDFSSLVTLLGRDPASAWLGWAERQGVVVRGVDVRCERCGAEAWRAMGELAPPIACRGCGRTMDRPFGPAQLTFRYRGTETLLRVLEHDALVHLYAMRYFARLFEPRFDRSSLIYGMYPGVDFYERVGGNRIGEADLVAVLSNGSLVVGECKRHGAGLTAAEIGKLDALAERLKSPWTFLATTDVAADCPPIWVESQRSIPSAPASVSVLSSYLNQPSFGRQARIHWHGQSWHPQTTMGARAPTGAGCRTQSAGCLVDAHLTNS
jgi:hypothetical protein